MKLLVLFEDGHWETIGNYPNSLVKKNRDKNNLSFIINNDSKETFKKHLKLENLENFIQKKNVGKYVKNIKNSEEHQSEIETIKDKNKFKKELEDYNLKSQDLLDKNKSQRNLSKIMLILDRTFNRIKEEYQNIEVKKNITNTKASLIIKNDVLTININYHQEYENLIKIEAEDNNNNKLINRYIVIKNSQSLFEKLNELIKLTISENSKELIILIRETKSFLEMNNIPSQSKIEPNNVEFYLNFKNKDMATISYIKENKYKWAMFIHNIISNNETPITIMIETNSLQNFAKIVKTKLNGLKKYL